MKKRLSSAVFITVVLLTGPASGRSQEKPAARETGTANGTPVNRNGKPLTSEEQQKLLSSRLRSGVIIGPFGPWGSFLYAVMNVAIHTDDPEIAKGDLHSPFPDFYKPKWQELFDTMAAQTESSWKYDSDRDFWVFAKPKIPKPFTVTIADKWSADDRDIYVNYKPPTYPVGMDIYYYGSYSADDSKEEAALWEKVRDYWAIGFASKLRRGISISEMQKVAIAGVEALYFETAAPRNGVRWRQWVFVKEGKAFVIVSTLRPEDKQLLTDVQAMIKSFRLAS